VPVWLVEGVPVWLVDGVPVWLALAVPVPLALGVPVPLELGVPVPDGEGVPVWLEEGVPVPDGDAVPVWLALGVPVPLALGVPVWLDDGVPVWLGCSRHSTTLSTSSVLLDTQPSYGPLCFTRNCSEYTGVGGSDTLTWIHPDDATLGPRSARPLENSTVSAYAPPDVTTSITDDES
jgi:hypothetical protein